MTNPSAERKPLYADPVPADEAAKYLGRLLDAAQHRGERVVISRRGIPCAVLVGLEDLAKLEAVA